MKTRLIKSLQTMRLFASLGVLTYHLWHNYLGVSIGHPGTDFFLVLVGTVAAITEARRFEAGKWLAYLKARYIRLYVTFIPLFFLTLLFKRDELTADWAFRSFFFIPMPDRSPVIGATWMLSFFLLFYFVVSIGLLFRKEGVLLAMLGSWSVGVVAYVWLGWNPGISGEVTSFLFNERNLNFVFGYLAGMLIRDERIHLTLAKWIFALGFLGVVAGTALLNLGAGMNGRSLYLGIPVTLFVIGLASLEQNDSPDAVTRFVTSRPMVWLGSTSYVLFLSHSIFINAWHMVLPVTPFMTLLITAGAVVFAALGYHFWEEPILQFSKTGKFVFPRLPSFTDFQKQKSKPPVPANSKQPATSNISSRPK